MKDDKKPKAKEPVVPQDIEDDGGELTPEQEKDLRTFSIACTKALVGEGGVVDNVVSSLKGAQDVPQALADLAYQITAMLDEKSGGLLDEELMIPAGADVLGQLAEAAQAAKVPVRGKDIAQATRLMLERFLSENGVPKEQVKGLFDSVDGDQIGGSIDAMGEPNAMPAGSAGMMAQQPPMEA